MCVLAGQSCPGPVEGPLIVDMTAKAKNGMRRWRTQKQLSMRRAHIIQFDRIDTRESIQVIVIKAFYADFLSHFTAEGEGKDIQNQLTWLERLPNLVADRSDNALVLALIATATAYGAFMTSNSTMTQRAQELYGVALRTHHSLLQNSPTKTDITVHMVSTSVLLSFFEAMQATTADAYRAHIYGAAQLLEVTGPGQCEYGVLCQLFYHIRTQVLFVQLATDQHSVPISAKKILYDTLMYKDPPLIQRLMCYVAALRELHTRTVNTEQLDGKTYELLKLQVNQLWDEYRKLKNLDTDDITTKTVSFSDAFTALMKAYFSSAQIFIAILGLHDSDLADLLHHSQVILEAATFLDTAHNAIAYMRMATPLLSVALHTPSYQHRKSAVDTFKTWSPGNMRGISVLALDAIRREEVKETCFAGS